MDHCEILVVGGGAAGISAAVAAWDAGCRSITLADRGASLGGILPQCTHKGFGLARFGEELTGPDYAARLIGDLRRTGVRLLLGTEVLSVSPDRTALLSRRGALEELGFRRLILAAGCRERTIGTLPVAGTRPAGLFTAGQAQEMINLRHAVPGREVLILGSGDLGMIMARCFTQAGSHVIAVLEQEVQYRGMARNYHRCIEECGIPLRLRTTIREIHGTGRIRGVTAVQLDSGVREEIPCDTLITALGLISERTLLRGLEDADWLQLAGNCRRVHDIVDSAAAEAGLVGAEAAASLL